MTVLVSKTDEIDAEADTEAEADVEVTADSGAGAEDSDQSEAVPPAATPRGIGRVRLHWRAVAICAALVASAATAGWLYFGQYRTDQLTASATTDVVGAATQGSVALLSYAPGTVDRDLAAAQSNLTGEFLTYYGEFAKQIVAPATKQRGVQTTATVVRAAPAEVNPNDAKVLVFLNQITISRDNPDPVQAASSVMVGLAKVDGRWLISSFDPI
ncbi:twin-arginine translocation pathway signal [Mycolicibacterium sp. P1-18]|uniref:twin-arginine translocation pathway signal n=1 Tax=Mycolicibacterium sp. P1-18 TaxID=2024615 RepID=UPI0011F37196|nr:twin-arginine translocation pathway signal [Mycolicibacterium sp. P1-18]KAA0096927.1 twin-arginine translocation pathway signal [Mycolicibacterium sp. P1-18]